MTLREAHLGDIPQIQSVRNSVKENMLSNPGIITDKLCEDFLFRRGKGWVCEVNRIIVGFSIADLVDHNVWALFVRPEYERKGIGKRLHDVMLEWYFAETSRTIWLSTSPNTRAEAFYRKAGWMEAGLYGKGEIKFEMTHELWMHSTS